MDGQYCVFGENDIRKNVSDCADTIEKVLKKL